MKKIILIDSETGEETEQHIDDDLFDLCDNIKKRNKIKQSEFWNNILSQALFDLNIK